MIVHPNASGLAALNNSPYPTMGDDNRIPGRDRGNRDKDPKKKNDGGQIPAFMPGQRQDLAEQLGQGFGGEDDQWMAYLKKVYGPSPNPGFRPGRGSGNGNRNNNNNNVNPVTQLPGFDSGNPLGRGNNNGPAHVMMQPTVQPTATGLAALRGRNF